MAKFDLPEGSYIDVRFTFDQAYDKVSEKGNYTLAAESGRAEVIGHSGFESITAVFGRYGSDRGKINFFAKMGKAKPATKPAAKPAAKGKTKPAAEPAAEPAAPAKDLEAMLEEMLERKLAALLNK